jgi:iron transport multicopper oxidase
VIASFAVSASGVFTLEDYFQPFDYRTLDDTNSDLGSGALSLLDPTVFNGPGVSRIGVTCGKSGKAYVVNAEDLGGYKQGSGGTDDVLQTITLSGPVWAGMGSYPLEGGYI